MPLVIVIQAQHTGGYSVGLDIGYTSPTALALLVLTTNKNTTVTPDPDDSSSNNGSTIPGGSVTPGGNPNDPLKPTPNPGITPVQ